MSLRLSRRSSCRGLRTVAALCICTLAFCSNGTRFREPSAVANPQPSGDLTSSLPRDLPGGIQVQPTDQQEAGNGSLLTEEFADSPGLRASQVVGGEGEGRSQDQTLSGSAETLGQDDRLVCGAQGCLVAHGDSVAGVQKSSGDASPTLAGPEGQSQPSVLPEDPGGNSTAAQQGAILDQGSSSSSSSGAPPQHKLAADVLEEGQNFALAREGAKVVAANKEARKPDAILDCDGDTFLKNECKADKWVIIELSQMVKPTAIVLSQYELYSGRIEGFEVRVRQDHPRHDGTDYAARLDAPAWTLVGRFTAANTKGTQVFRLPAQLPYAKYLQVRVLSHYGSEAVCALNDIRVHGKSAIEDFEDSLVKEARGGEASGAAALLTVPEIVSALAQANPAETVPQTLPPDSQEAVSTLNGSIVETVRAVAAGTDHFSPASDVSGEGKDTTAATPTPGASPEDSVVEGPDKVCAATKAATATEQDDATVEAPLVPPVQQSTAARADAVPGAQVPPQSLEQPQDGAGEAGQSAGEAEKAESQNGNGEGVAAAQEAAAGAEMQNDKDLAPLQVALDDWPSGTFVSTRHTTIYDMLVQDLKLLKLQQKLIPRQMSDLQKNLSADINSLASGLAELALRLAPEQNTAVARKEDAQSSIDMIQLQLEVAALRGSLERVQRSQLGLGLFLGALAALLILRIPQIHQDQRLFKAAVMLLALANGIVGLLLQQSPGTLSKATWSGLRLVGLLPG